MRGTGENRKAVVTIWRLACGTLKEIAPTTLELAIMTTLDFGPSLCRMVVRTCRYTARHSLVKANIKGRCL